VERLVGRVAPGTPLARVQRCWPRVVTALAVAAEATPTGIHDGVLTITCSSAVYAQELHFLAAEVIASLNGALGEAVVDAVRVRSG
jgi:predicted nucleic acid-binding Zn ribbon protein